MDYGEEEEGEEDYEEESPEKDYGEEEESSSDLAYQSQVNRGLE